MIEECYRTNVSDKIAAPRNSMPSLGVMGKKNATGGGYAEGFAGIDARA
jgi:hypothetical protein